MNDYKGLLEDKFKVDLTILLQNVNAMEGFMENPMVFNQCLKEIAVHFNKIDNPNINKAISPMAETLFSVLPYGFLCNNNVEFIKNNQKTFNMQNDKAHVLINSTLTYTTYVTQIKDALNTGPIIIDIRLLNCLFELVTTHQYFDLFMKSIGLGRERYIKGILNDKPIWIEERPSIIKQSFKSIIDMERFNFKKGMMGKPILGKKSKNVNVFLSYINKFIPEDNINYTFDKMLKGYMSANWGQIPTNLRHLDVFLLSEPTREDKRRFYDKLYVFYCQMNVLDTDKLSLEDFTLTANVDPKIIQKETSRYYEYLGRKMRRYFGIKFHEIYKF